jgi:type IV pilus assembly protein PilM
MEKLELNNLISNLIGKKVSEVIVVDSRTSLKLLYISLKGEIRIKAVKIIELPLERKQEETISRLHAFVKEFNIERRDIIICPALKTLQGRRIQIAAVADSEIPDALKWRIKEDFGIDPAKSVFDYQVVSRASREDGSKILDLVCVSAESEEVRGLVLSYKNAGFNCLAVGSAVFGFARMMSRCLKESGVEPVGILQVMQEASFFSVYKDNKVVFYRQVPVGISDLKTALSAELVMEQGRVRLSPDEINKLIFDVGIPAEANQVMAMVRPVVERLGQEIKRSLDYYRAQFAGGDVKKVFIGGDGVRIKNLDKALAGELGCGVEFVSWTDKIAVDSGVDKKILPEVCGVIGLALDLDSGINLLPKEFKSEKIESFQKLSLRWIAIIAGLFLLASFILAKASVSLSQKRLDNTVVHLSTLSEIRQIKVRLDSLNAYVADFRQKQPDFSSMLKRLSNIMPAGLFLNSLTIDCATHSGNMIGFIKPQSDGAGDLLTRFVDGLEESGFFSNVDIDIVQKSGTESEGKTFKLIFTVP